LGFLDFRLDSIGISCQFPRIRDFTPNLRYFRSDFRDNRNFRKYEYRDIRLDLSYFR